MCIPFYGRNAIIVFVCFEGMGHDGMVMEDVNGILSILLLWVNSTKLYSNYYI